MLNLPRADRPPSFGNGINDLFLENLAVHELQVPAAYQFSAEEKAAVKYGIQAATELVTEGSPFLRNDLFM